MDFRFWGLDFEAKRAWFGNLDSRHPLAYACVMSLSTTWQHIGLVSSTQAEPPHYFTVELLYVRMLWTLT